MSRDIFLCIKSFDRNYSVSFIPMTDGDTKEIFFDHLENTRASSSWREVSVPLDIIAGKTGSIVIFCGPGPHKDPNADWLAILEFHICSPEQLTLSRARMHNERRAKNEIDHFSKIYKLPMFNKQKINAFSIAQQLVRKGSLNNPINFRKRMIEKAKYKKLHILSLCSGVANTEASLIRGIEDRIDLTLFDINDDLLNNAASKFKGLIRQHLR